MGSVLIAYNIEPGTVLRDFIELCSDEAKQICVESQMDYTSVCPPAFDEHTVVGEMATHILGVVVAHGDSYGIYNEKDEYVVSTRTTNYNFANKGMYCVVCLCAQHLLPHLQAIGIKYFVGYEKEFSVVGDRIPFMTSAMSGLRSFLSGDNVSQAKAKMLQVYDEQIAELDKTNPRAAIELAHDRESLVFYGEDHLRLSDLV